MTNSHCLANPCPVLLSSICVFYKGPNLTYTGQPVMQPCNSQYSAILMRTWHASDESNNYATPCVQKIYVKRPSFSDIVFPPNRDGIQAPALSCSNPNTNPSNTGYPTINGKPVDYTPPKVLESPFLNADFDDGVVTIRKGSKKKVLDFTR